MYTANKDFIRTPTQVNIIRKPPMRPQSWPLTARVVLSDLGVWSHQIQYRPHSLKNFTTIPSYQRWYYHIKAPAEKIAVNTCIAMVGKVNNIPLSSLNDIWRYEHKVKNSSISIYHRRTHPNHIWHIKKYFYWIPHQTRWHLLCYLSRKGSLDDGD